MNLSDAKELAKGDTVYMTVSQAENNYGLRYVGQPLTVSHIATNSDQHPGYDEATGGILFDFEELEFSLYEWEIQLDDPDVVYGFKAKLERSDFHEVSLFFDVEFEGEDYKIWILYDLEQRAIVQMTEQAHSRDISDMLAARLEDRVTNKLKFHTSIEDNGSA